jgi:membrane-bound inhibitor of C-type lysozyme
MVYILCSRDRDQIVVDNNRASLDNVWLNSGRRISKKIKSIVFYTQGRSLSLYSGDRLALVYSRMRAGH